MLPKIYGIGRLTRDPEMRTTGSGKAVVSFSLAFNEKRGEEEVATFVDCTAWEKTGEIIAGHFTKGKPIFIEGRVRMEVWEKDGQKRSKLGVIVERFEFIGNKSDGENHSERPSPSQRPARPANDKPKTPIEDEVFGPGEIPF